MPLAPGGSGFGPVSRRISTCRKQTTCGAPAGLQRSPPVFLNVRVSAPVSPAETAWGSCLTRRDSRSTSPAECRLIDRAQRGEMRAFEELFTLYKRRVLNLAYRSIGNHEDARDVTQEVFVRLFRFLPRYDPRRPFFTWLYRITVNVCHDHLRAGRRNDPLLSLDEVPEDLLQREPETDHSWMEVSHKVFELTHCLPMAHKTAFLLRDVEGCTCRETAAIMGCPQGTVRSHLHHARRRLRELLRKRYPELVSGFDQDEKRELS